jgi:hypothetical protein
MKMVPPGDCAVVPVALAHCFNADDRGGSGIGAAEKTRRRQEGWRHDMGRLRTLLSLSMVAMLACVLHSSASTTGARATTPSRRKENMRDFSSRLVDRFGVLSGETSLVDLLASPNSLR